MIGLTTFALTVVGGALAFALGQVVLRGAIDPALELKRLIGKIAFDLTFQADRFQPDTPEERPWRDLFRGHSCKLRELISMIVWYPVFRVLLQLPPRKDLLAAVAQLLGHSNRAVPPVMAAELGGRDDAIRKLLRIEI